MKKRNYFKGIILVLISVLIFSCGSSDNDEDIEYVTSISIQINSVSIELGESVTFIVKDNNNNTITGQSLIYVDGSAISGAIFTPTSEGEYLVNAKYETFTSSSVTLTVTNTPNAVIVNVDSNKKLLGESFTLSATSDGNEDVTNEAAFYIDGVEITGSEFTPTERGNYALTAIYSGVTSNEITITIGYNQKVLVEDYTGTWCGYCPRLAYNLEQAESKNENVIAAAIHNGDPMVYEYEANMRAQFGVTGFPTGKINRTLSWNETVLQVLSYTGINEDLGLALETSLSGNTISVDVKIGYINAVNNTKIIVYLLEDDLIYSQRNYMNNNSNSPWYDAGDPIADFVHNNVLRKAFTNIFGDTLPDAINGDEYSNNFTLDMPSSVEDSSKLKIVAFVIDSSGKAINAQRVNLGSNQDYQ